MNREQPKSNNNKINIFLENIGKTENMIRFLESIIVKINKKNISSKRKYRK